MREMRISYFCIGMEEKNTQVNYADEGTWKNRARVGFIRVDNFAGPLRERDFCPLPIALDLAARLQQIV
jgi:hypothetical protein